MRKLQSYKWFLGSSHVWKAGLLSAVTFPRKAERNHSLVICSDILVKCARAHTHILQMGVSVLEQSILQHDACEGQARPCVFSSWVLPLSHMPH